MKKILSLLLALMLIIGVFCATGVTAYAKFDAQKQQYNTQSASFNYSGKEFAYVAYTGSGYEIRYASEYGTQEKVVYSSEEYDVLGVSLKGDYIYWVNRTENALMRAKKDGTSAKKIVKLSNRYQSLSYIISGKKIIYKISTWSDDESSTVYTCKLNGKGKKKLIESTEPIYKCFTYKNKLYYFRDNGKKCRVMRCNLKTGKSRRIAVLPTGTKPISMEDSKLYYARFEVIDDGNDLLIVGAPVKMKVYYGFVDVATKEIKKLGRAKTENSVGGMIMADNKAYVVISQFPSGQFARLKKGKPVFIKRSEYDLAAVQTGFFKNKILIENTDGNYIHTGFVPIVTVK